MSLRLRGQPKYLPLHVRVRIETNGTLRIAEPDMIWLCQSYLIASVRILALRIDKDKDNDGNISTLLSPKLQPQKLFRA